MRLKYKNGGDALSSWMDNAYSSIKAANTLSKEETDA